MTAAIPRGVRNVVRESDVCYYCTAVWASVIDHVIPVKQGGAGVLANLVPACQRCNAQKSGRTPAQWKADRLAKGLSWPPPNCQWALPELAADMAPDEVEAITAAVEARYPPMIDAATAFHDRYYTEKRRSDSEDRAELLEAAQMYRTEIEV